ncbi:hypothetical protein [Muricoccus nepalensis]|uniref:hypothetical protein n=1 Tax=Muricoccus nepalensis TaxID=1854500 RepID=UPI00112E1E53|nr:hypothetical protein [Roseomonas nepalensis]
MIATFRRLEAALRERAPASYDLAQALADNTRDALVSGPASCWEILWDKPVFANARISSAEVRVQAAAPHLRDAWHTIGLPDSSFHVRRVEPGRKRKAFELDGETARLLYSDFGIAAHRMLAIQGAAAALRKRVERSPRAPYADLVGADLLTNVETLRKEKGEYWGTITVLHLLTDFGLACKPDIHLVRSFQFLGIAPEIRLRPGEVPNLRKAVAIVEGVRELAVRLHPAGNPTPQDLRRLDGLLLGFSRNGLLEG